MQWMANPFEYHHFEAVQALVWLDLVRLSADRLFYLSEAQLHWFGLVRIPVYFVLLFYRMGECIDKK